MDATDGSLTLPVIAGLVVGIALIVIFSSMAAKPSFSMSDEEIRVKLMTVPEVQAFEEKAAFERLTPTEEIRHEGNTILVEYSIQHTFQNSDGNPDFGYTKELSLFAKIDSFGRTHFEIQCGGGISTIWTPTVSDIKTTTCLENP